MEKKYGLIIPKSNNKGHTIGPVTTKLSIFDEDSDSDTPSTKPTGICTTVKRQDKINQEKALTQDPTVYQYDEVFDEIDQQRKDSKLARKDLDRKPKYISKLLAAADKRKRENERRIEREVQKERELEGDMYKDKESFITSAYKQKLEEMRELEQQEKREEYLEGIGDVRKQGNLDGFYRHLYHQTLNKEEGDEKPVIKKEDEEPTNNGDPEEKNIEVSTESKDNTKERVRKRKYRAHRDSVEGNESDVEAKVKKEHLPSNLDADSDFSIDSSDSEEEKDVEKKHDKHIVEPRDETDKNKEISVAPVEPKQEENEVKVEKSVEKEVKPKKPKIDIWKKRTVGEKFDEAVKRYFERKALREMGQ
ncbi:hypothetical protein JTB14_000553 [Gonioctena quinquepunctata]|nr:hypothetical protein JTB14_000553 [Gonioctena quinquepunctata]